MSPDTDVLGHVGRPGVRFSIVSAVYNVNRYLGEFIDSIEKQTFPLDAVQVVVVDDGSTDESLTTLKEWAQRRPGLVTVVSKENGGQGSARNKGLEYATGEWITFTDPDDFLDREYLQRVDEFLRDNAAAVMIATNRIYYEERTNEVRDGHPLRRMFEGGDRAVDVTRFPEFFHGAVNAGFFRADILERTKLRFDLRVRPNFEDGHFCCCYLLEVDVPVVGFLQSARYLYRRRADRTSTLQTSLLDPDRFVSSPRYGHLDALQRGARAKGVAPEWLQNFVLYEMSFYFTADSKVTDVATAAYGEVAEQFLQTLNEISQLLSPYVVESFALRRLDSAARDILLHSFTGQSWVTPYVVVHKNDDQRNRVQLAYRYVGDRPSERILMRGRPFEPTDGKVRTIEYWGRALLMERLVWIPARGTLRLIINGNPVAFRGGWPERTLTQLRPAQRERLAGVVSPVEPPRLGLRDRLVRRLAHSAPVRRVFGNAWVLLDRLHNADDNGERLFRYLRKNRRRHNAWFVLRKDTPDWKRLRSDGYRRVVPHGSLRWELLMLNCKHLISSHSDVEVCRPPAIVKYGEPQWRFTFLQHGVIKDDISRWLNPKRIDLFITSTPMEHASIIGDDTPYVFTSYEVKMTGLPRFDRLRELGAQVAPSERTYLLVCPTWRHWLNEAKVPGSHEREIVADFEDTEYAQMWLGFLRDDRLREIAERERLQIGFMPHPNIQPVLDSLGLPEHVTALRFAGQDVQRTFAQAAMVVTDYSSMAFNAAYIERPVVYFQFDAEIVHRGGHLGRYGYFDYEQHGFGPVATSVDQAIAGVRAGLANGRVPARTYLDRIQATFPNRDGQCCSRVVAAIEAMSRPPKVDAGGG